LDLYTTDAQNIPLYVSAFHGCHLQGPFTVVKIYQLKQQKPFIKCDHCEGFLRMGPMDCPNYA
jgi:hypothetical protein